MQIAHAHDVGKLRGRDATCEDEPAEVVVVAGQNVFAKSLCLDTLQVSAIADSIGANKKEVDEILEEKYDEKLSLDDSIRLCVYALRET